ncbi:MAG: hypothetical protein ACJ73D_13145, partial [Pyrinomonadaceae bacterium]
MKTKLLAIPFVTFVLCVLSAAASAQEPKCTEQGSIRSVISARTGNFETVTFTIIGKSLPDSVEVTNVKPPITNYGGDNLHMKGPAYKSVSLHMVPWNCISRNDFLAATKTIR